MFSSAVDKYKLSIQSKKIYESYAIDTALKYNIQLLLVTYTADTTKWKIEKSM